MFFPEGVTHPPRSLWFAHLRVLGLRTGYRALAGTLLEHLQQRIRTHGCGSTFSSLQLAPFTVICLSRALCAPLAGRSSGRQALLMCSAELTGTSCDCHRVAHSLSHAAHTAVPCHSNPAIYALSDKNLKHLSLIFELKNCRDHITFGNMRDL